MLQPYIESATYSLILPMYVQIGGRGEVVVNYLMFSS